MSEKEEPVAVVDAWGAVRQVSPLRAKALVARGTHTEVGAGEPALTNEGDDDPNSELDQYDDMSFDELRAAAKDRDVSAGGSADDIRTRLRQDDARQ